MTPLPDAAARARARTDLDHNLVVDAGAGTGKTTVLIDRILELIGSGRCVLDQIAAITFTEKAAGELKLRLRNVFEDRLASADSGDPTERFRQALEDLDRAHVSTIHAFCGALLRARPAEAGVDPEFAVLDPLGAFVLRHQVWDRWIGAEMAGGNVVVARAVAAGVKLGSLLDAAQYLLENRDVLPLLPAPAPVEVDAFVAQLQRRLSELRAMQADCRNVADGGYQHIHELTQALAELTTLGDETREAFLLTRLRIRSTAGNQGNWQPRERLGEVKTIFRELREALAELTASLSHNLCCAVADWLGGYLHAYDAAKRERGALDFTDLLIKTRDLLRRDRTVRGDLQRRFRVLLVDEFQDTDPLQTEIVFFLAERTPRAARWQDVELAAGKLFLVGDPKQSIYRFRRADIELYDEAKRAVARPEAHGATVDLQTNFRSRRPLVEWVNACFSRLIQRPDDAAYQPAYVALAAAPETLADAEPGVLLLPVPVGEEQSADRRESLRLEARLVAEVIAQLRAQGTRVRGGDGTWRPLGYGDVGVLFRDNTAMHVYEDELRDREIPYRITGGKRFYLRDEVTTLLALLRALANPKDQVALVATLRGPFFGVSDEQLFLFKTSGGQFDYTRAVAERVDGAAEFTAAFDWLQRLHQRGLAVSPATLLAEVFNESHVLPLFYLKPQGDQRVANLLKLIDIARALEAEGVATLRGVGRFLGDLERLQAEEGESPVAEERDDVVRLLTIHKAKGLEFPVVVLADGGQDLRTRAPLSVVDRAQGTLALRVSELRTRNYETLKAWEQIRGEAEELRLLYVAATRARDYLVLPQYPEAIRGTFLGKLLDELAAHARIIDPSGYDLGPRPARAFRIGALAEMEPDATALTAVGAWEQDRSALFAAAGHAPLIRSVSTVTHATQRPEQQRFTFGRRAGERIGSVVHAALQGIALDAPAAIEPLVAGLAASMGLESVAIAEACGLVQRALALPVLARARAAGGGQREVPFTWRTGAAMVEGVIDLVFREHDGLVIVDYKTDDVSGGRELDERAAAYRPQALIYAAALEAITGTPVQEVVLAFLRPGIEQRLRAQWRVEAQALLANAPDELAADAGF